MKRFRFMWDYYIMDLFMKKERYFFYMARKWGDRWYRYVEEELG